MQRRTFVASLGAAALSPRLRFMAPEPGRLLARPHVAKSTVTPGLTAMGLATESDTQLFVPSTYVATRPAGVILGLHGATQDSAFTLRILRSAAEAHGYLLIAPKSREITWDMIRGQAATDEALMDRALAWVFDHCNVDPARVVIAGFSDGASMALTLGLINADLFRRVIAFSPGFIVEGTHHGKSPIFISHGTRDQILPIDQTSRRIVPELKRDGYQVTFHEFDGPHAVPADVVAAAMTWLDAPVR